MSFKLPNLNYSYDALEPYIDSKTMEIHHTKHHLTYINNLNKAIKDFNIENQSIEEIFKKNVKIPIVRNNSGGFYNHSFFWDILSPNKEEKPSEFLGEIIDKNFNSFENFKKEFTKIAITHFGSGWIWLCIKNKKLIITSTSNQDNPLMHGIGFEEYPILGLDVWEHAYYLKYQNRRADYVDAFWKIVNWNKVLENYKIGSKYFCKS